MEFYEESNDYVSATSDYKRRNYEAYCNKLTDLELFKVMQDAIMERYKEMTSEFFFKPNRWERDEFIRCIVNIKLGLVGGA